MKNIAPTVIAFACLVFSLTSCSSDVCFEDTDPLVVVALYSKATGAALKCDSIKVYGIGASSDTLLVDKKSVTSFSFSLDPIHNESAYRFILNKVVDIVVIQHSNYPHFISPECGYTIYSDIVDTPSYTDNIIKTINVDNKSVTLNGERNLRLFY